MSVEVPPGHFKMVVFGWVGRALDQQKVVGLVTGDNNANLGHVVNSVSHPDGLCFRFVRQFMGEEATICPTGLTSRRLADRQRITVRVADAERVHTGKFVPGQRLNDLDSEFIGACGRRFRVVNMNKNHNPRAQRLVDSNAVVVIFRVDVVELQHRQLAAGQHLELATAMAALHVEERLVPLRRLDDVMSKQHDLCAHGKPEFW